MAVPMDLLLGVLAVATGWTLAGTAVAAVVGPAIRLRDERSPRR